MTPVTVLGGFLGSGKTTALNGLLSHATRRIAVLVNDFGAVNIDAALVRSRGADVVALSNGCVCCALGPDLGASLATLLAYAPDQIVVETSGVADPWRTAQLVRLETGLALDAVLVLVDAARFPTLLADPWLTDTLQRQAARADLLLLTHTDTATPAELAATHAALTRLRPNLSPAALGQALPTLLGFTHAPATRFAADEPGHPFRTWSWSPPGSFAAHRLRTVMEALPQSVLRLKGFCRVDDTPHLLQAAGRRWAVTPRPPGDPPALVAVGTPDMPGDLAARFAQALA